MAARYYGISRGEGYVSEGSSTTSKEIELVIPTIGSVTKMDILLALDAIRDHLLTGTENFEA